MPVPAAAAPPPTHAEILAWSVVNIVEPWLRLAPGPDAPPVGNAWQVAQPASPISVAPGSALIWAFVLMFDPEIAPGAEPPAIVSAISTAGVARPSATP